MTIKVIAKGSKNARVEGSVCPWIMDVPPETKQN